MPDALQPAATELSNVETRRQFLGLLAVDPEGVSDLTGGGLDELGVVKLALKALAIEVVHLGIAVEVENAKTLTEYGALAKATGATWLGIMGLSAPGYVTNDDARMDDDARDLCARSYLAGVTIREVAGIDGAGR